MNLTMRVGDKRRGNILGMKVIRSDLVLKKMTLVTVQRMDW